VTRPITDRVKENLFNRLMAMGLLGGGYVADLFAGIGSLGLESLSRGAEHCTFVECHRQIRHLLQQNLDNLDLAGKSRVLDADMLAADPATLFEHQPLRLIFVDPPYHLTADGVGHQRVHTLAASLAKITEPDGALILRSGFPNQFGTATGWLGPEVQAYGNMLVHIYIAEEK